MVSHIGHSQFFLRYYEDVEVVIKRLKTRHLIFVVEARDYDFVVSQPLLNFVKFS